MSLAKDKETARLAEKYKRKYESGDMTEAQLFIFAISGPVPNIDPETNRPINIKQKKSIILERIEKRLGPEFRELWQNGFPNRSPVNWKEGF